ncbi:MAG: 5-oxoprolinase subunit PxpA [bacterium]
MIFHTHIDLNADVGERPEALADGSEEALIKLISSANIACGGHAGDPNSMRKVVQLCASYQVSIGAHPGYPDKDGFGRIAIALPVEQIEQCVFEQVGELLNIAASCGQSVVHVKPHGALYNTAAKDAAVAAAIARGVERLGCSLTLVGLADSLMLEVWNDRGFRVIGEAFADRIYEPDGSLRPRIHLDSLITDPHRAALQARTIVAEGLIRAIDGSLLTIHAQTLCIHGDTPGALQAIQEIRGALAEIGCSIRRG